jgi:hypothetical protein
MIFYHPLSTEEKLSSPIGLKNKFGLSDKREMYGKMVACAKKGDWGSYKKLYPEKGYIFNYKSKISEEGFIELITMYEGKLKITKGPVELKPFFIENVKDVDKKFKLFLENHCYEKAIKVCEVMKDKERLQWLRKYIEINVLDETEKKNLLFSCDFSMEKKSTLNNSWFGGLF